MPHSNTLPSRQLLHFKVLDIDLCLDLQRVLKILPLVAWQVVPEGPPYLRGLVNIRGNCLPMIDLAARLGLGRIPLSLDTPMLWCQSGEAQAVLLISSVSGGIAVAADALQMQPLFGEGSAPYLAAVVQPEGTALLLDMQRVLDIEMMAAIKNSFADPRALLDTLQPPA
ncbi:MAG: chemotaxis protein CheW [Methylococcaceae bacterium]|nr:MAG: chemotaxis protein CheW [Methylococcaceae bacterium]